MRSICLRVLVPLALALAPAAGAAGAAEAPPTLRLPDGVHPLRVAADLTVVPERESFDGTIVHELELERPARTIWLNATGIEILDARLAAQDDEQPATVVTEGENFAGLELAREVPPGRATLTLRYRGKLEAVETLGLFRQQSGDAWYAFSQFEATYARRAFPCFDEPGFRTPWKLTLHVRRDHLAFSNTAVVAEREEADGMKAVEFAETPPIPSYLVALAVGPFAVVDAGAWGRGKTPVRVIVARGGEARTGYAAEVSGELLARLEEYFDIPYAFGKLDNLAIPQTVTFGAMENPGLITWAERILLVDPDRSAVAPRRAYASISAHENAHQWFGNLVTMAWWDDIWLNEGFADWIADKIVADWKPEWWSAADRVERRGQAMRSDSLPSARRVRRPIASNDDIAAAFDAISYSKGASLLEMFEAWMGPERFRQGIRSYLRRFAWGNASSSDFLSALSEQGAPEVAQAFASFLDQPGAPVVSLAVDCPAEGPARLTLAQRRYTPLGATAPLGAAAPIAQRWRIPVRARLGAGARSESLRLLLDEPTAAVELSFCPEWVAGNDEGIGYYVTEYRGDLLARLAARAPELAAGEQIALLEDAAFLVASGDLPPADALGLVPAFADSSERRIVEAAIDIAKSVDDSLVPDRLRPNYERYLDRSFAPRMSALGLAPRPDESADEALLRPRLIRLLTGPGENAALAAEARRMTERWLADRSAIAPDLVGPLAQVAARRGDAALFDALLAAAEQEKDPRLRGDLLRALGGFREPALVDRALALMLSGRFDVREASWVVWTLSADRRTRPRVFEWVEASYDSLVAALPEHLAVYMVYTAAGFCEAGRRDEVESFFRPRVGKLEGGEIALEQTLDIIDICVARRAAQEGAVTAFLERY